MNRSTKGEAGWSEISAGVPICSTRLWFITTILSATSMASYWSWVTITLVSPDPSLEVDSEELQERRSIRSCS